ncbi:hypothetical protein Lfu02_35960 [Longispora fulva]|uniref:DUF2867 domain-containing protein n=1 Tax=Longispora fulva TaxID=619741 RepID=A0A8J7GQM7_9ACTN|nr:hypothetical protein [Longispora fulva]MBG6141622.1 hypothetical protein [Longispora fulva]GIG59224.1 hypothetical protein Lfu02_35960 [Longispora fulva]
MILDDVLPTWDKRERHGVALDVSPAAAMLAIETVTWAEVPAFRAIMALFSLGSARLAAEGQVLDLFATAGFSIVGRSAEELVLGGIQRFLGDRTFVPVTGPLKDFDEPGHIAMACNLRYADGRLTTETRVLATDARSRRLFAGYWCVIRGGSGLIRHVWLRGIRGRALRQPGQDTVPD